VVAVSLIVRVAVAWDPAVVAEVAVAKTVVPVEAAEVVAVTKVAVRRAVDLFPVAVKAVEGYRGDEYPISNVQCPMPKWCLQA